MSGYGAGFSLLDDTQPHDWRVLWHRDAGPMVELAHAQTRGEAQEMVKRLPGDSWEYWVRRSD